MQAFEFERDALHRFVVSEVLGQRATKSCHFRSRTHLCRGLDVVLSMVTAIASKALTRATLNQLLEAIENEEEFTNLVD
jgi:hypothetical protein